MEGSEDGMLEDGAFDDSMDSGMEDGSTEDGASGGLDNMMDGTEPVDMLDETGVSEPVG